MPLFQHLPLLAILLSAVLSANASPARLLPSQAQADLLPSQAPPGMLPSQAPADLPTHTLLTLFVGSIILWPLYFAVSLLLCQNTAVRTQRVQIYDLDPAYIGKKVLGKSWTVRI